jgi:hypothetical protein
MKILESKMNRVVLGCLIGFALISQFVIIGAAILRGHL